jgi:hypothetical protein
MASKLQSSHENLKIRDEKHKPVDLLISEDLGNPANVNNIFKKCREHSGVPNVVVYSGKCSRFCGALPSIIVLRLFS